MYNFIYKLVTYGTNGINKAKYFLCSARKKGSESIVIIVNSLDSKYRRSFLCKEIPKSNCKKGCHQQQSYNSNFGCCFGVVSVWQYSESEQESDHQSSEMCTRINMSYYYQRNNKVVDKIIMK